MKLSDLKLTASLSEKNKHLSTTKDGRLNLPKVAGRGKKQPSIPKPTPKGLLFIINHLILMGVEYELEYKFDEVRKFRFDVYLPGYRTGIEFEGLVAQGKAGGHQTKKHYTKDATKYNLCTSLGYKVFRYTFMNYKNFIQDLETIKNKQITDA